MCCSSLSDETASTTRIGSSSGALGGERRVPTRGSVEDEEADLVLGNVDRAVEADALLPSVSSSAAERARRSRAARSPARPRAR